ncbi:uncharacterized protein SCHCODRAFT_02331752 [Schizophyllum commune H4-8]|uniref:uncharacterized protein n=1 Tax=Schizophyllum commune (strain H4-8 / FGSC 9210) TaxID=578458 RepID=UPI0021604327|nr:uncharacterized protein SCHCODRAFT_02331752 [Schizophyllum commune H4-8]KAI5889881.1 hypothetical protein SCHCODRAFT_02331752 [Schizophyllum commune H4-8]
MMHRAYRYIAFIRRRPSSPPRPAHRSLGTGMPSYSICPLLLPCRCSLGASKIARSVLRPLTSSPRPLALVPPLPHLREHAMDLLRDAHPVPLLSCTRLVLVPPSFHGSPAPTPPLPLRTTIHPPFSHPSPASSPHPGPLRRIPRVFLSTHPFHLPTHHAPSHLRPSHTQPHPWFLLKPSLRVGPRRAFTSVCACASSPLHSPQRPSPLRPSLLWPSTSLSAAPHGIAHEPLHPSRPLFPSHSSSSFFPSRPPFRHSLLPALAHRSKTLSPLRVPRLPRSSQAYVARRTSASVRRSSHLRKRSQPPSSLAPSKAYASLRSFIRLTFEY